MLVLLGHVVLDEPVGRGQHAPLGVLLVAALAHTPELPSGQRAHVPALPAVSLRRAAAATVRLVNLHHDG
eukprot:10576457-Alexandrium_andersonii.AAC.1